MTRHPSGQLLLLLLTVALQAEGSPGGVLSTQVLVLEAGDNEAPPAFVRLICVAPPRRVRQVATPAPVGVRQAATPAPVGVRQAATPAPVGVRQAATPAPVGVRQAATPYLGVRQAVTSPPLGVRRAATPSPWGIRQAITPAPLGVRQAVTPSRPLRGLQQSYTSSLHQPPPPHHDGFRHHPLQHSPSPPDLTGPQHHHALSLQQSSPPHLDVYQRTGSVPWMGKTKMSDEREGKKVRTNKAGEERRRSIEWGTDDIEGYRAGRRRWWGRRRSNRGSDDNKVKNEEGETREEEEDIPKGAFDSSQPLKVFLRGNEIKEMAAIAGKQEDKDGENDDDDDDGEGEDKEEGGLKSLPYLTERIDPDNIKWPKSTTLGRRTGGGGDILEPESQGDLPDGGGGGDILEPESQGDLPDGGAWHLDHLDPSLRSSVVGSELVLLEKTDPHSLSHFSPSLTSHSSTPTFDPHQKGTPISQVHERDSSHLSPSPFFHTSKIPSLPPNAHSLNSSTPSLTSNTPSLTSNIPSLTSSTPSATSNTPTATTFSASTSASNLAYSSPFSLSLEPPPPASSSSQDPSSTRPLSRPSSSSPPHPPTATPTSQSPTPTSRALRSSLAPLTAPSGAPPTPPARPTATPSSVKPTTPPPPQGPFPAGTLALLRCSSPRARTTTVYVIQECDTAGLRSLTKDVLILCPRRPPPRPPPPQAQDEAPSSRLLRAQARVANMARGGTPESLTTPASDPATTPSTTTTPPHQPTPTLSSPPSDPSCPVWPTTTARFSSDTHSKPTPSQRARHPQQQTQHHHNHSTSSRGRWHPSEGQNRNGRWVFGGPAAPVAADAVNESSAAAHEDPAAAGMDVAAGNGNAADIGLTAGDDNAPRMDPTAGDGEVASDTWARVDHRELTIAKGVTASTFLVSKGNTDGFGGFSGTEDFEGLEDGEVVDLEGPKEDGAGDFEGLEDGRVVNFKGPEEEGGAGSFEGHEESQSEDFQDPEEDQKGNSEGPEEGPTGHSGADGGYDGGGDNDDISDQEEEKAWAAVGVTRAAVDSGRLLRRSSRDLGINHYTHPDSAPQLRYTPIEQTVSPGSPVSLKCSALGAPYPVITWTRDGRPLLSSHRTSVGNFRTELGEVVSHVNLSQVTVREGGTYTCIAHNAVGSVSHSARLNVYGPPFVRAMDNVTTVAGEDVRLWCPAGGYPTPSITWRRDGHTLPNSLKQEVLTNGTLVVKKASREDVGRYSCLASGRQGQTASSHTFLHVLKPPTIEPFSFRPNLREGERTQLTCMVNSGDLPITINWLKDSRHLQHDPDIDNKQIHEYSRVLLFKTLREHHSGSYTCEAANAAAIANYTATVRVKVSPRWVLEPRGETALVGSTVVMDCSARGHPKPVLTWMKAPGKAAQDFQAVVLDGVRSSQASNGSLVLPDIAASHAGWYLCQAANSVGEPISKAVQLIVHAPARVVTEGRRVTGHAGQTVTLSCEATGDDPLTLTWHRHHTLVSRDHRTSLRESSVGGMARAILEIRAVTAADAGPYTCLATNSHGDHSQVFRIAVIEPPQAPSGVVVSEVTSRSARISWTLPQPAAVTIQYRVAKDESWVSHGRNVSVGQWATSHVLTGLAPHQAYTIRLMAHNDLGASQPSHVHDFTTLEEAPSGAPRDVRVAEGGPRALLVTWRAPPPHLTNGPLRGYIISLRHQNLQGRLTHITRPVTAMAANVEAVEQYEVRGLTPASLYEVAVRAFNKAGPGPLSSPRIVDSTSHDAPSCPPAGVSCRGSGRGSIRVWWSPPPTHCVHAPVSGYSIVATPTKHGHHTTHSSTWEVSTTNLEKNLDALPPATNISIRVKAFNEVGFSPSNEPVFCVTEDDVPGPPRRVRVVVTGATTLLVTWSPPYPHTGTILHYTLYSARDDQVALREVVGAGGSEATWQEISSLTPASRVQVWVTATTLAGEGSQSPRLTAVPTPTPAHAPVAVGGGGSWRVGAGSGVTLGCRGLGSPPPAVTWTKAGTTITSNQLTQLLPGGDLHLSAVRETANYTCWIQNSVGIDSLTHQVIAVTTPPPPTIALASATHDALNLTITPEGDGGAPILGYTLHHRGRAGEWLETGADPGVKSVVVRGLPCGAPHHLYITAWNSHGTSSPSPVLLTNTLGSSPGRPDPAKLVEVNVTCVTLRLYVWPELGCPITHWKVELGSEESEESWTPLHAHVTRETTDLGLCDLTLASWHLLRITAASTSGDTSVVYRVATRDHSGGSIAAKPVQEVLVGAPVGTDGWLDAHVVAGVVSAVLLAAALIICVCVAVRKRRYGGYRQGESLDSKGGGEEDNARNSEITRSHLYSPTPTKKPHGSLVSLKSQDDASDPYEICPYATFSVGSSEGTLEYGLSLHALTPRDCLDHPVHSDRHAQQSPAYGQAGRQRAQSHYKETEIAYISNRSHGEYANRPKSFSGTQPTSATTPAPSVGTSEQGVWAEESRKDTRNRPHRPRSLSREGAQCDSSTESNDASSPVQQRQHYQHPQIPPQQHHQHHTHQLPPQHPQQQPAGRAGPHPLPPVRLARVRSESSSSDSSPLTPPRPLHPPSAFSDSREFSEAECDREVLHAQGSSVGNAVQARRRRSDGQGGNDNITSELTVLLQRYKQQQQQEQSVQQKHQQKLHRGSQNNPYSINV
ncbi:uncharacterized protein [Panulirus ornatus]|uniref:uncharacterized protein isoform X2 n=1 Tax=Panulirus ornatus TaxID=150431 RepID=UPI003A86FE65